ncbi:MAG TPA: hypothetical protein VFW50_18575 [Streptosporangiaceae bacterium]|nr:hypothetical protein [Streptosporangiaceae bacterium]
MIRKLLGRVAVVASVVGMTVVAPIAVAGPAVAQAPICGFLDDGGGAGSANSLPPGVIGAGVQFQQVTTGAWRVCWNPPDGHLYMESAPTWCEADNNGLARLRTCNDTPDDQVWSGPTASGSFHVKNKNGGYLCADGGVGNPDVVVPLANCSNYHTTWAFESSS